jgi:stage II sporulation protein D
MRRVALGIAGMCVSLSVAGPLPHPARAQEPPPERLILTPAGATTFRVQAVYPNSGVECEAKRVKDLRARYRGKLEIVRQANGRLALIDHLTFDEYLAGLAEMPRSWPLEALKAQVVAARTYAIANLRSPRPSAKSLGYDICSTDQCQVYRGLTVEQGAFGEAWVRAVRETKGRILEYNGRPITAYYFSTSSGRTNRSFPGGSPQPYLKSVPGQDGDSPLAEWTAAFPLADIGPILKSAGSWEGGAVTSVRSSGDEVIVSGGGRSATLTKRSFRIDLNDEAACVYPDRYPAIDAGAKLPQTVPSATYSLSTSGGKVVLRGRGWGHGVGMSQYGARSLAERGRTYTDILSYYYAGVRASSITEPGAIRVLVAENASLIRVQVQGKADVTSATGSALAPGDRFEVRGGPSLDVRRGVGPSLAPVLTATLASSAPITSPPDGTFAVSYTLSGSARVSLVVRRDGKDMFKTPEVSQVSGANVFSLTLGAPGASPTATPSPAPSATASAGVPGPLSPGAYELAVEAYDGLDRVRTTPVALTIQAASPPPVAGPTPTGRKPVLLFALIAAAIVSTVVALYRRGRRPRPVG